MFFALFSWTLRTFWNTMLRGMNPQEIFSGLLKKMFGTFSFGISKESKCWSLKISNERVKKKKTFQQTSRGKFFWGSKCHNRPEIKDIFLWIIVKVPRKHFYFQKRRKSKGLSINKRYGFRSNVVLQKYKVLLLKHPFLWIWIHFFKDFFVV